MNDVLKSIRERYSCRAFGDKAVGDGALHAIAEAGVMAPSGMNRQPWQFVVVKDKALIREMEEEGMRRLAAMPDKAAYNRIAARSGKLFYDAPAMIVIAVKEADPKGAELIDLGIAAQNISLAATSLGVDNLQCGLAVFCFTGEKGREFEKRLGFLPGYGCGLAVLLGYAKQSGGAPHKPDLGKITFIG